MQSTTTQGETRAAWRELVSTIATLGTSAGGDGSSHVYVVEPGDVDEILDLAGELGASLHPQEDGGGVVAFEGQPRIELVGSDPNDPRGRLYVIVMEGGESFSPVDEPKEGAKEDPKKGGRLSTLAARARAGVVRHARTVAVVTVAAGVLGGGVWWWSRRRRRKAAAKETV